MPEEGLSDSSAAFKQSSIGKSRKFQVLYRNEEIGIGDIFIFRIHTLVESAKVCLFLKKNCYINSLFFFFISHEVNQSNLILLIFHFMIRAINNSFPQSSVLSHSF
jgi:hypothetical protein